MKKTILIFFVTVWSFGLCAEWVTTSKTKPACEADLRVQRSRRWVDLDKAIELLDISTKAPALRIEVLCDLSCHVLNRSVLARIITLRNLLAQADATESVKVFLLRFSELRSLPIRMLTRPEFLQDPAMTTDLASAKGNLNSAVRELFALTLMTLANRHPALISKNPQSMDALAEIAFMPATTLMPSWQLAGRREFYQARMRILKQLDQEKNRLLASNVYQLRTHSTGPKSLYFAEKPR